MRVIECNVCGDALSGATDEELAAVLRAHMEREHADSADSVPSERELRELLTERAYDAMDS